MESEGGLDPVTKPLRGNALDKQIVDAIAEATGSEPLDVPPLYQSVDLDALKALVVEGNEEIHVEFEHVGCRVTVDDGTVVVDTE